MGVNIFVHGGHASVSMSYGSLQELRVALITALIENLTDIYIATYASQYGPLTPLRIVDGRITEYEDADDEDERVQSIRIREALAILEQSIITRPLIDNPRSDRRVDYDYFEEAFKQTDHLLFHVPGLIGLYKFINHPDNEGYHSTGDALDIAKMMVQVQEDFNELPISGIYLDYLAELIVVFNEAFERQSIVEYT